MDGERFPRLSEQQVEQVRQEIREFLNQNPYPHKRLIPDDMHTKLKQYLDYRKKSDTLMEFIDPSGNSTRNGYYLYNPNTGVFMIGHNPHKKPISEARKVIANSENRDYEFL